ncbi:hypothetical protein [Streptococcus fryi]
MSEKSSELEELLKKDRKQLKKLGGSHLVGLELTVPYPQVIVGDVEKSKLLILGTNPGWDKDYKNMVKEQSKDLFEDIKKSLNQPSLNQSSLDQSSPSFYTVKYHDYWFKKLEPLLGSWKKSNKNIDRTKLADYLTDKVALLEFFPFHSRKYNDNWNKLGDPSKNNGYLDSQNYIFNLIRNRIEKKDVMIIISRSRKRWLEAIPELMEYDNCYVALNPQSPVYTSDGLAKLSIVKTDEVLKSIFE